MNEFEKSRPPGDVRVGRRLVSSRVTEVAPGLITATSSHSKSRKSHSQNYRLPLLPQALYESTSPLCRRIPPMFTPYLMHHNMLYYHSQSYCPITPTHFTIMPQSSQVPPGAVY